MSRGQQTVLLRRGTELRTVNVLRRDISNLCLLLFFLKEILSLTAKQQQPGYSRQTHLLINLSLTFCNINDSQEHTERDDAQAGHEKVGYSGRNAMTKHQWDDNREDETRDESRSNLHRGNHRKQGTYTGNK